MVSRASFEAAGMRGKDDTVCPQLNHRSRTDPPPGEWVQPDFDDRDWPRSRADWIGRQASTRAHTHRIALRDVEKGIDAIIDDPDRILGVVFEV